VNQLETFCRNRSNLEDLVIDARVVCEGGGGLASYRRPPEAAVCVTIWAVEYPVVQRTCGEICDVEGCVSIRISPNTIINFVVFDLHHFISIVILMTAHTTEMNHLKQTSIKQNILTIKQNTAGSRSG
jgi:hypothetical protein